jgi:hypothetical protein
LRIEGMDRDTQFPYIGSTGEFVAEEYVWALLVFN